jgi:sulfur carrier protein
MKIMVNGTKTAVNAETIDSVLKELGYNDARVATALNGSFVPVEDRAVTPCHDGDQLEIVAPKQGG